MPTGWAKREVRMSAYNFRWNFLGAMTRVLHNHYRDDYETVCEWGSGYSTFVFSTLLQSRAISNFVSVDQYEPYLDEVSKELAPDEKHLLALAELFEVDRVEDDPSDTLYYTTSPLHLGKKLDISLVDGRARSECLLIAALSAGPDALVILDDSERARYLPALRFFDVVDRELRFAVLKVKPAFANVFASFANDLSRFSGAPIATPKEGRRGGMGHVPDLPPLSDSERADLEALLGQLQHDPEKIVCWSEDTVARTVMAAAASPENCVQIVDRAHGADVATDWSLLPALITGRLDDFSKDPNLHYANAPLGDPRHCDLAVIAGHRRNECAIAAAFLTEPGARVLVRDADRLHHSPAMSLFETVATKGRWTLAEPAAALAGPLSTERAELFSQTAGREVTPPSS